MGVAHHVYQKEGCLGWRQLVNARQTNLICIRNVSNRTVHSLLKTG